MRFGILFEADIRHDYWLNMDAVVHDALPQARQSALRARHPVRQYLRAMPTAETLAVLAGHGMIFKGLSTGFLVGVELEGTSSVPRRRPGPDTVLRFALKLTDADFTGYSAGLAPGFYRFSNVPGNVQAGLAFLSRPVAPHQAARVYAAGEIRAEPGGGGTLDLFQALRDTGPSGTPVAADWRRIPADTHDPAAAYQAGAVVLAGNVLFEAVVNSPGPDLSDATQWTELGVLANQYATRDDQVALRPAVFAVGVSGAGATVLELRVRRAGAPLAAWQRRFEGALPLDQVQADLRGLADGLYRLDVLDAGLTPVPGLGFDFYLSPQGTAEGWFGMVEIGAGSGELALLDGAQALRSPRFRIRFLNQAARRRFVFPRSQPVGAGAEVAADPADDRILVTPDPVPLTRIGGGLRLRADDPATAVSERILLPHQPAGAMRKQDGQWFSDLYLSNLPPLT